MSRKMVIPGPGDDDADDASLAEEPPELGVDFYFDLRAMVIELEEDEDIVDLQWETFEPVPRFTIETIEHAIGVRVPRHIRAFWRVTDGFELSWNYRRDGQVYPGGGCHLFDFATVFDTWLDDLWVTDGLDDEEADFVWTLRGFDHPRGRRSSRMTVLCVEEEYPTYDLFLHDLDDRSSALLDVSFRDYFDCLLQTRGAYGWRALLTEDGRPDEAIADERGEDFFPMMERLFPDAKLERLR